MREATKYVHELIVGQGRDVPALAAQIDKRPSTLFNELNPYGSENGLTHKLGLDDAVSLMRAVGDWSPLARILAGAGYCVTAAPVAQPLTASNSCAHLADCMTGLSEVASTLANSLKDGALTRAEKLQIFDRVTACLEALQRLGGAAVADGE